MTGATYHVLFLLGGLVVSVAMLLGFSRTGEKDRLFGLVIIATCTTSIVSRLLEMAWTNWAALAFRENRSPLHEMLGELAKSSLLLKSRLWEKTSGEIDLLTGSIVFLATALVPLLFPPLRRLLNSGNCVPYSIALAAGAWFGRQQFVYVSSASFDEHLATIHPMWLTLSAVLDPMMKIAPWAFAISVVLFLWRQHSQRFIGITAGLLLLILLSGRLTRIIGLLQGTSHEALFEGGYVRWMIFEQYAAMLVAFVGLIVLNRCCGEEGEEGQNMASHNPPSP